MSKKKCEKCKKNHYCDKHHVLPKGIFGKGETNNLCKNCHDEFHRELGHKYLRKENKQPEEFYLKKYYLWLTGLCLLIGLFFYFFN